MIGIAIIRTSRKRIIATVMVRIERRLGARLICGLGIRLKLGKSLERT
jgi:hypothetical protein